MKLLLFRFAFYLAPVICFTACNKFPGGGGHGHNPSGDTTTLYIAVNGNDNNAGTSASPLATLNKAIEKANPGYTILIKPGTYYPTSTVTIQKSGTEAKPITIKAATSEKPVFDFSNAVNPGDAGILVQGSWWHFKDFVITKALYKGILVYGESPIEHNVFENLTLRQINGVGLSMYVGSDMLVLNCDAYENFDTANHGQNADGFAAAYSVGPNTKFIGCRSWNNSDDGFDCWEAATPVTFENCYTWENGVNLWGDPSFAGNGNGFKLGRGTGSHILRNCLAWNMEKSGFDLNGNSGGVKIDHCVAILCGKFNFDIYWGADGSEAPEEYVNNVLRNNISAGGSNRIRTGVTQQNNNWNIPLEITADDFVTLDASGIKGARGTDGSLPTSQYLHLASGSAAIDAGIDIGRPFNGTAPDLGAFESSY